MALFFSWGLVEVPRYLYYFANEVAVVVPGWLHFLRYNLFTVLYPAGITGEVACLWAAICSGEMDVSILQLDLIICGCFL